jgi:hypothetical protein
MLLNVGSGGGAAAAAPAAGGAAAGGAAAADEPAKEEEKKEEGTIRHLIELRPRYLRPALLTCFCALQRRRNPTRIWASVSSTRRPCRSKIFLPRQFSPVAACSSDKQISSRKIQRFNVHGARARPCAGCIMECYKRERKWLSREYRSLANRGYQFLQKSRIHRSGTSDGPAKTHADLSEPTQHS